MANNYYYDLMDFTKINSASSIQPEHDRAKRIEEGRRSALLEGEPFKQFEKQSDLISQVIGKQKAIIDELKKQTEGLRTQVCMLEDSEKKANRKAKWAIVNSVVATAIAAATLIITILAWALPR